MYKGKGTDEGKGKGKGKGKGTGTGTRLPPRSNCPSKWADSLCIYSIRTMETTTRQGQAKHDKTKKPVVKKIDSLFSFGIVKY
jgi:hypothetical protein